MSPAVGKPLKICIRGLPADTDHRKLHKDLRERGFDPIFMRHVNSSKGPGVLCVQLQTTPNIDTVFALKKLQGIPVRVEAWRGRQGPPQCQRCQGFNHSAAECLQEYRCVHCARPHPSKNCNRPYDIPKCANCSGPHPANDLSCPAIRREQIAKAGKVLRTSSYTLATLNPVVESSAPSSLMAEANANYETWLTSQRRRRRKKTQAKSSPSVLPIPQSEVEKLKTQVLIPVKKSETQNETQKLAVPIKKPQVSSKVQEVKKPEPQNETENLTVAFTKPQAVSSLVEEALTKSISKKENQQTQKLQSEPVDIKKSQVPVNKIQVDLDTKEKYQDIQSTFAKLSIEDKKRAEMTMNPDPIRTKIICECVQVLQHVLSAIQEGHNPVPIILGGLADLCQYS